MFRFGRARYIGRGVRLARRRDEQAKAARPRSGQPRLTRGLETFGSIADRAERLLGAIGIAKSIAASLAVAAIVVLLVGSTTQRYLIGSPLPFTEEVGALLFVVIAFMSATEGFLSDRQIRIELVWRALPERLQGWAMVAGHAISLAVLWVILRETWRFAELSFVLGSRSLIMEFTLWPWMAVIPFSVAVLMLAIAARILVDLHAVLTGQPVRLSRRRLEAQTGEDGPVAG